MSQGGHFFSSEIRTWHIGIPEAQWHRNANDITTEHQSNQHKSKQSSRERRGCERARGGSAAKREDAIMR
eukprot:1213458-Amphidinium_carterae.1